MDIFYKGRTFANWRGTRYVTGEPRPLYRGLLHMLVFYIACPVYAVLLFYIAETAAARVAAAVQLTGTAFLYGTSYTFHRRDFATVGAHEVFNRLDHIAIYANACATHIPPAMLLMLKSDYGDAGAALLVVTLVCTAIGIVHACFKTVGDRLSLGGTVLTAAICGCMLPWAYHLRQVFTDAQFTALLASWALYASGALIYATRACDFVPDKFGYHESFHAVTVAAGACAAAFNAMIVEQLNH